MNRNTCFQLVFSLFCFTIAIDGYAFPKDYQLVSGTSEFKQIDAQTLEIYPSDQAIINYSKFDIGVQEKVRFIQNSSSSCVLNRVCGKDPSQIFGSLDSNGKVFLVNPNGVYFGPNSSVNVGSLIASTLDISNEDFLLENYSFKLNDKCSEIRNEGVLESIEGSIVLMSPKIQNLGAITAKAGTVLLASGKLITLDFMGDGLIQFSVEGSLKEALIEHLGDIKASTVALKLPVAKKAISEILNLQGLDEGDVFIEENGVIKFASIASIEAKKILLEAANLNIEGSINAASLVDKGGEVHLFGRNISLDGVRIDASGQFGGGEVLIGGEFQGKGNTPYASKVSMNESSQILANAIGTGDGGLVVLWSKDQTLFNGKIYVQGGAFRGNGGLVETSSKDNLRIITGHVDALASNGEFGEWLLDPTYLFISSPAYDSCTSGECSSYFGDCNTYLTCTITQEMVESAACNVTLQAISWILPGVSLSMQTEGVGITVLGCGNTPVDLSSSAIPPVSFAFGYGDKSIVTKGGAVNVVGMGTVLEGALSIDTTGGGLYQDGADVTIYAIYVDVFNTPSNLTPGLTVTAGGKGVVTVSCEISQAVNGLSEHYYRSVEYLKVNSAKKVSSSNLVTSGTNSTDGVVITAPLTITSTTATNISVSGSAPITLGTIDLDSNLSGALTISTASGSITTGDIGGVNPPTSCNISSSDGGVLSLAGITTGGGGITIDSPVILNSMATMTSNNGDITFSSTVDGAQTLDIVAGTGSIFFNGVVGGNDPLEGFQVSSGNTISLPNITTIDSGFISITPPVLLNKNTTLNSGSEGVVFKSSVYGAFDLTIKSKMGLVDFKGDIGGATALTSLTVSSAVGVNLHNITTSGGQIKIDSPVILKVPSTVTSNNGLVDFEGTINAPNQETLEIVAGTGLVTLTGSIGETSPLGSFKVSTGSLVSLGSSIYTDVGSIVITPDIQLTGTSTMDTTNGIAAQGASITLSAITGIGAQSLTCLAGPGTVSIGMMSSLDSVIITCGAVNLDSSITAGLLSITNAGLLTISSNVSGIHLSGSFDQSGIGSISLGQSITAATISLITPISLTAAVTLTSGSTLKLLSTVNGSQDLILDAEGDVALGVIGGVTPLSSFTVASASELALSNITTSGPISITPPSTLSGSTTITSNGYPITFSGLVSGAQTFTVNAGAGAVSLGALGSTTTGFLGDITITGGVVGLNGDVDATGKLDITNSDILTMSVESIFLDGVFTQSGTGDVSLATSILANTISFESPVTLIGTSTLTSTYDLTLSSDVMGGQVFNLTSQAGAVSAQNLGITGSPLGNITLTAFTPSSFTGIVTQGGIVDMEAPILLLANTTITSGGGTVTFAKTVDAASTSSVLTLLAGAGTVYLKELVGNSSPLTELNVTGGSIVQSKIVTISGDINYTGTSIQLAGNLTSNAGSIYWIGPVVLSETITATAPGGITTQTIADSSSTKSITLTSTGGDVSFGSVGPLLDFTVNGKNINQGVGVNIQGNISYTATGDINLPGDLTTTAGSITWAGFVRLDNNPFTANTIGNIDASNSTINGIHSLTLESVAGTASFGFIGNTTAIGNLAIIAPIIQLNSEVVAAKISLTGDATFFSLKANTDGEKILITGSSTLSANSVVTTVNGPITVDGTINATDQETLEIVAGTGLVTLTGSIGEITPLGSFKVSTGSQVDLGSSIYTALGSIEITPNIQLTGTSTMDTTNKGRNSAGADITFSSRVDSKINTSYSLSMMAGNNGIVRCSEDVGGVTPLASFSINSAANVFIKNVTANSSIDIVPHMTLSIQATTFTSNGDVLLGGIDGTAISSQSIKVLTGVGAVALGVVGANTVLSTVEVPTGLVATIHSITTSGSIEIDIPVVLAASTVLTAGSALTLKSINGTTVGKESLTILTGTEEVVLMGDIGKSVPPCNLDITGSLIRFEGALVSAAGMHSYHSPATIAQNIVFRSLGDITFSSNVDPAVGTFPSFTLYPGSGRLTFAGSVGDAPFKNISIFNAGSFYAQDIFAGSLRIVGGLPSIFLGGDVTLSEAGILVLDGGPISLGGTIEARRTWFRSYGDMSNLGSPMPINISENYLPNFDYFNAIGGVIGSPESPIKINTEKKLLVGASDRADFTGIPTHSSVRRVPSNLPCIVTFNGVTIYDCHGTEFNIREVFNTIPKILFYVPGLYSSWDNLSNWEYFEQEPSNLGMNPNEESLLYWVLTHRFLEETAVKDLVIQDKETEALEDLIEENILSSLMIAKEVDVSESTETLSNFSIKEHVLVAEEVTIIAEEKGHLEKIIIEIVEELQTQKKPEKEAVNWEFYVQFPEKPLPLELFNGMK